jgi:hypothetical protein
MKYLIEAIQDGDFQLIESEVGMIERSPNIGEIRKQILAVVLPPDREDAREYALSLIEEIK